MAAKEWGRVYYIGCSGLSSWVRGFAVIAACLCTTDRKYKKICTLISESRSMSGDVVSSFSWSVSSHVIVIVAALRRRRRHQPPSPSHPINLISLPSLSPRHRLVRDSTPRSHPKRPLSPSAAARQTSSVFDVGRGGLGDFFARARLKVFG